MSTSDSPPQKCVTEVPNYGLKVRLNHTYPENRSQGFKPGLRLIWDMLPLVLRYIWYYIVHKIMGKSIVMDYVHTLRAKQIYGVPIGGIGCGTIGRGYRGEFCRFQLKPGLYEYNTVDANQFIVTIKDGHNETIFHSLLSTFPTKSLKSWESLIDGSECFYTGLYPRSWTEYDLSKYGVMLTCRQITPIIPHNYKDSSLPCAVFVWDVKNISEEDRTVTIAFTFKNGVGDKSRDRASTCSSKAFTLTDSEGVILYHTIDKMQCSYSLAAKTNPQIDISKCLYFDPNSDGIQPWIQLKNNGSFDKISDKNYGQIFGEMACGIATKVTIQAGNTITSEMTLVWDMPSVQFPKKQKKYTRYYTKHFEGDNTGLRIVRYAFENYHNWERAIHDWQKRILDDENLPDWYKSALFNESYYISDGGAIWVILDEQEAKKLPKNDPRLEHGKFALLEGHEYRMYNTYDVHFYASFSFVLNFPLLQSILQYDMRDAIFTEIPDKIKMLYDGEVCERKVPNTVPHDIGDPGEEPFILLNSYPIHDVSQWRDLNSKFVLQVFRDAFITGLDDRSVGYLNDMYNACYTVMHKSMDFDIDGDGLIENSGSPDQTFDTWVMTGASAYCGGLWLAALFAMTKIADALQKPKDKEKFQELLDKGKAAFERKLWNGKCYNFDCSDKECRSIMADQLCGQWYLRSCGFNYEVFPQDRVKTSLKTIYENNVQSFCDGRMGAVNGFIDGVIDKFTIQSQEVWTGVTYALAASMLQEGMKTEAFNTAGGMYKSMSERFGLSFDTPEALYPVKYYRAIGYMRPLSIWSMQMAIDKFNKNIN
ncbi:non-lysosomal glucosylceramidase [Tribolium madens]|uniref:non-lysosomal glucosylceramidase n=1 Tax=Tribolium madens TaxID=41895 RepID=UPI001CF73FAF|nr:non-lysosomal glucosylceramidase [Tribolium madens]XP_044264176.1 non-lysosomal glucosylceramidase [Tribolium madens]